MPQALLSTSVLQGLLACLHKQRLPASSLLATGGCTVADLDAPDPTRARAALHLLWTEALRRSNDPYLPLHIGLQMYVEQLGLLGTIVRNCPTLADALARLEKYSRLSNQMVELTAQPTGSYLALQFAFLPQAQLDAFLTRVFTLLEFGYLTGGIGQLVGRSQVAAYINTSLPAADRRHLETVLQCAVRAADGHALALPLSLLQAPLALPNEHLRHQLEGLADLELAQLTHAQTWAARVQALLLQHWGTGQPSIEQVARHLHLTVRVLQRRLQGEGTTFQAQAEQVRKALALQYLQQPLSVNEVAFFLGYDAPSAFARAFRQWMGCTPQAYRQQQSSQSP